MTGAAHVVSTLEDFRAIFTVSSSSPTLGHLLLCYEVPFDDISTEGLRALEEAVQRGSMDDKAKLHLFLWDCTSDKFLAAKEQLCKRRGSPLLLIVYGGEIADTVRDLPLSQVSSEAVPRICGRLASFQQSNKPAVLCSGRSTSSVVGDAPPPTPTLRVDVAKMVSLGKKLLGKGRAMYAEKFFLKALGTLEAVRGEVFTAERCANMEEYEGSVAMCLAWVGLAQIVQGKAVADNSYLRQLEHERFRSFCEEPLSDASRACATHRLMLAAPATWNSSTCSQKTLNEKLQSTPLDHHSRSLLVITLFLAGDLERALTEAVKLHALGNGFGRIALRTLTQHLGDSHELVQRLGPLNPSE